SAVLRTKAVRNFWPSLPTGPVATRTVQCTKKKAHTAAATTPMQAHRQAMRSQRRRCRVWCIALPPFVYVSHRSPPQQPPVTRSDHNAVSVHRGTRGAQISSKWCMKPTVLTSRSEQRERIIDDDADIVAAAATATEINIAVAQPDP